MPRSHTALKVERAVRNAAPVARALFAERLVALELLGDHGRAKVLEFGLSQCVEVGADRLDPRLDARVQIVRGPLGRLWWWARARVSMHMILGY